MTTERKPLIDKQTHYEEMSNGLQKRFLISIRDTALDGIKDIKARLHRIVLSGSDTHRRYYRRERLKRVFEGSLWRSKAYRPGLRGGLYRTMYVNKRTDFHVNILLDPKEYYLPPIQIEIVPKGDIWMDTYKDFLVWLNKAVPGLAPSKIEYAIDQLCYDSLDVDILFWVERYSLYVPKQRGIPRPLDGGSLSRDKKSRYSFIWHMSKKNKIYERGYDSKKQGRTWPYAHFNRVRLEHKAFRKDLVKRGIVTLNDLLENPRFYITNKNLWHFRKWKETSPQELTKEWAPGGGPFQNLFKAAVVPNKSQYMEPVEVLTTVEQRITDAMKIFDAKWKSCR